MSRVHWKGWLPQGERGEVNEAPSRGQAGESARGADPAAWCGKRGVSTVGLPKKTEGGQNAEMFSLGGGFTLKGLALLAPVSEVRIKTGWNKQRVPVRASFSRPHPRVSERSLICWKKP